MESSTLHFLNVGHGDCTIIEHAGGHVTMIDVNNSKTLPDLDEEALAEKHNVTVAGFKSSWVARSWEDYYKSLLVDPREYWHEHFAGQQRGAEARHGVRRFGAAWCCRCWSLGSRLIGFVVVDPECSVVPTSL